MHNSAIAPHKEKLPDSLFVCNEATNIADVTRLNDRILNAWHKSPDQAATLPEFAEVACVAFDIQNEKYTKAVMAACAEGEVENTFDFHGNMHYRKVMLQTMRIISAHNHLYAGSDEVLSEREMTLLLIAAAAHDLGYDGKGNNDRPGRLEQQSFDMLKPVLEKVGFDDSEDLRALRTMFLSTDAAPSEAYGKSYKAFMKGAYRYHEEKGAETPLLPDALAPLNDDYRLALLACLLHEADIATSAGLGYRTAQLEGRLLAKETDIDVFATPLGYHGFLSDMCEGQMLTRAAKYLYDDNMRSNIKAAKAAVDDGNHPFPSIEEMLSE